MDIDEYFNQKKDLYSILHGYIEDGNDLNDPFYQNLIKNIRNLKLPEHKEELKEILIIVIMITKNHHRYSGFITKIEKILLSLKDNIKQTFSNSEIFDICKSCKMILYLLLKNDIVTVDDTINAKIMEGDKNDQFFCHFFIQEITDTAAKQKLENEIINNNPSFLDNYEQKRQIGENDSFVCSLIRNDSLEEFIEYVQKANLSLKSTIMHSIFETNSFLINKEPTLIEYATFFRSIRIFQYLKANDVELTPSLWLYAIHGRSIELIHQLKENKIEPNDKSYEACLKESIKCHHNDMANYILDNFLNKENESVFELAFRYHNYFYMPKSANSQRVFCNLCKYDYLSFVDVFLKKEKSMVNATAILKSNFFIIKFFLIDF